MLIAGHPPACNLARHAFVAPNTDTGMEVEICDTNVISEDCSRGVKVFPVRGRENGFVLLGPEEVYRIHGVILFKEVCEVCFECRLRSMRPGDLYLLSKRL